LVAAGLSIAVAIATSSSALLATDSVSEDPDLCDSISTSEADASSAAQMCEVVVGNLGDPSAGSDDAPGALLDRTAFEGLEWDIFRCEGSEILDDGNDTETSQWAPLGEAVGGGFEQVSTLTSVVQDPATGEQVGTYTAIRVAGVDETDLGPAVLVWLRQAVGSDEFAVEEIEVGGKQVMAIAISPELRSLVYVSPDTAYLVDLPDAASLLEKLP
jgi:hypothetical protein